MRIGSRKWRIRKEQSLRTGRPRPCPTITNPSGPICADKKEYHTDAVEQRERERVRIHVNVFRCGLRKRNRFVTIQSYRRRRCIENDFVQAE